jgi:hypothetical protein
LPAGDPPASVSSGGSQPRNGRHGLLRRRRLPRKAVVGIVVALLVGVAAAAAVDVYLSLRPALSGVRALHATVSDVAAFATPEARTTTRARLEDAAGDLEAAHRRIARSAPLSLAGVVPGLRAQRAGLLDLLADERAGVSSALRLLAGIDAVAEGARLRGGAVPLDALAQLSSETRAASQEAAALAGTESDLWGPLGQVRRRLDRDATETSTRLVEAANAMEAARTFLGGDGDRRYLVAIQNNAEMRDQGMVLSYATLRLTDGRPVFERSGSILELQLERPAPTPIPAGTQEVFGAIRPTQLWQSVNATADFAWSGRAMSDMYLQATGEAVDGVVAIDVPGLASLLRVLGTVQLEGIEEPLSADNLGRILLHDLYQGLLPDDDAVARRGQLNEVTRVVTERLTGGAGDVVGLASELGKVAAGGHLRLWSAAPREEQVFERTGLGGGPATKDADRTFHLAVENRTSTKLDYFVKPSVHQEVRLSDDGDATVRTTVVLHNQAPEGAEPSYQLGPDQFTSRPGEYIAWVLLWAPAGSQQRGGVVESGLNLVQAITTVHAGERVEGTFETKIPDAVRDGRLTLRLVPQPRLTPVELDVRLVEADGWKVVDDTAWQGPWDQIRTFTWRVRR